jgi:hypothetical protein
MPFDKLRMIGEEGMAARPKARIWRKVFLRALARTGNVRAAAAEAGVDPGTAYDHRAKDAGFAKAWDAALAKARARPPARKASADKGEELVLRRTKHGDQLVRAGAGRWSRRAEDVFFAALERTACVRLAAAACGFSTNALYARRAAYPEFAAQWDRLLAIAKAQIPDLLAAAAIASLDPDAAPKRGLGRLPKINVDQAIRISAIEERKRAGQRGRTPHDPETWRREEAARKADLTKALNKLLDVAERRQAKAQAAEGWTETPDGLMIPPGWVRAAPDGGEGAGDGG